MVARPGRGDRGPLRRRRLGRRSGTGGHGLPMPSPGRRSGCGSAARTGLERRTGQRAAPGTLRAVSAMRLVRTPSWTSQPPPLCTMVRNAGASAVVTYVTAPTAAPMLSRPDGTRTAASPSTARSGSWAPSATTRARAVFALATAEVAAAEVSAAPTKRCGRPLAGAVSGDVPHPGEHRRAPARPTARRQWPPARWRAATRRTTRT